MYKHPLAVIQENDAELFAALTSAGSLALREGALPAKCKLTTALALDTAHGLNDVFHQTAL
jgi:hypothetical protein